MNIERSHETYRRLASIHIDDIEFFDGATLARALRSPRPNLVATLLAEGALSNDAHKELNELWQIMQRIQPQSDGNSFLFDNIFDLLLWVYVQTPAYDNASDDTRRSKLVFRGHRDAKWSLETTAQRLLKTPEENAYNQKQIDRFIRAIRAEYPQKLLETELEQEAVAQHYGESIDQYKGFATTLLDFTTDVDVAAYFATKNPTEAVQGTIFMCDTTSLLRDGRVRFMKIPEHFVRPNVQSGLFLKLPDALAADTRENLTGLFTRLNFYQYTLDDFAAFQQSLGDIESRDEIAALADRVKAGKISEEGISLADRLGPALTLLHDPAHPEILAYGRRIASYAGIITDEARLGILTDVLCEIVKTSTTGVRTFISHVFLLVSQAIYGEDPPEDVTWLQPFIQLTHILLVIYKGTGADISDLERAFRGAYPESILLLDPERPRERAVRVATQLRRTQLRRVKSEVERVDPQDTGIHSFDFAQMGEDALSHRFEALEFIEAMGATLIVLNLDGLVDRVGNETAKIYLAALRTLKYGVVATAAHAPHGFFLRAYFDLVMAGSIESDKVNKEQWTTKRWKAGAEYADLQSKTEPTEP